MKATLLISVLLCLKHFVSTELIEKIFDVHYISGSPDGVFKAKILAINGLFRGPTIEANVGDILRVKVINNIQDGQNTTIHWHGIHQYGTPFEDGTSHISQCPLKAGHHQIYEFPLNQTGTYWYHAHENSQYTEGLWGSLIVRNYRERFEYDDELLITLNDWYHRTAHENEGWHLSTISRGSPPYPDAGMINGRGRYNCTVAKFRDFNCTAEEQRRHIFKVTPGKRYRVRVINVSAVANFRFSIDGHKLNAIEVDGIDTIRQVQADIAELAAGQRYSFIVTMNANDSRFLIRADMMTERLLRFDRQNINPYPEFVLPNVTAILKYRLNIDDPANDFDSEPHDFNAAVPPRSLTNPVYLDENLLQAHDGIDAPSHVDKNITLIVTFKVDHEGIRRGSFNARPFKLPSHKPLLGSLFLGEEIPHEAFPVYVHLGDVVQVIINNHFLGHHPLHLHGHSFWVLGHGEDGDGDYDPARHKLILNGARRDTVIVNQYSWTVIRFVADNPGLWSFHCHIDWHNLSGMAMTFVVEPEMFKKNVTIPAEGKRVCALQGVHL